MSIASVQQSNVVVKKDEIKTQEQTKAVINSVLATEEENSWLGDKLRTIGLDGTADWLEDKDKKSTDGKDDGHISVADKAAGFAKGLVGIVKVAANNPLATIGAVAVGVGLTALAGPAIFPALVTVGLATGTGMVGYGAYKAATAETDAEAKRAWETMGEGVFALATSVLGAKAAVNAAGKAGMTSAMGCEDMTVTQAVKQCIKTTPESIKLGYSNAIENSKSLLGLTTETVKLTSKQVFEQDKVALKNKMAVNIERTLAHSDDLVLSSYYKDPKSQQAVMDLIDENNIELAKALFKTNSQIESLRNSSYAVGKESVCEYYLETIPKILKSNNKEMQDVAMYIANSDDIVDKFYALKVLTPENASQIRALKPYVYTSTEQVASASSQEGLFSNLFGASESDGIATVEKTMSIDRQLWSEFTPQVTREELLPMMGTDVSGIYNTGSQSLYHTQYYAKPGVIPNVPGAHHPVNIYTGDIDYSKYVIYEEISPSGYEVGLKKAKELLEIYGSKAVTETATPVTQTADMKAAQKAAEIKRVGELVQRFMEQK